MFGPGICHSTLRSRNYYRRRPTGIVSFRPKVPLCRSYDLGLSRKVTPNTATGTNVVMETMVDNTTILVQSKVLFGIVGGRR